MSVQLGEAKGSEALTRDARGGASQSSYYNLTPPAGMLGLWQLRPLIELMVRRDLQGRFRGSVMGAFWSVINPLGHMLLYTFVFSIVLKVRLGPDASTGSFALFLMAGLLPWQSLSESCLRATTTILENPNLVKRVVFPLEILPLVAVISSMVTEVIALTLLAIIACISLHTVHWTLIYLPLILFSQFLFVGGVAWLLSSMGVFLQDIRHAISLFLSAWMYSTPIVYPASQLPASLKFLLWINPMAGLIGDFRRTILEGLPPDWNSYFAYTSVGLILWFAGYFFFYRIKKSFADVM